MQVKEDRVNYLTQKKTKVQSKSVASKLVPHLFQLTEEISQDKNIPQ